MKRVFSILMAVFIGVFSITSCSDDGSDDVPAKKIKLQKSSVSMSVEGEVQVEITQGNDGYKVKSSAPAIVSAKLILEPETNKKYVVLKGKSAGESKVIITDSRDEKAEVKVQVISKLSIPKEVTDLEKGGEKKFQLNGVSKDFEVSSSDENVVKVQVKDGKLVVTAVGSGEAKVTVKDKRTGVKTEVAVNIPEEIKDVTVNKSEITIPKGMKDVVELIPGSGDYAVESSNEEVATAEIKGGTVVINSVKKGVADIKVIDNVTKKEVTIKVTVSVDDLVLLETETDIALREGELKELHITAGSGNYEVTSDDTGVATVARDGNTVKITGVEGDTYEAKTATVKVKDTESEVEKVFNVKVFKKLSIGKKVHDIKQGETSNTPIVQGDKANFSVVIDDDKVASYKMVEVYGLPEVEFTGIKPGTTFATITDGSGVEKVVAITVKAIEPVKIFDLMDNEVSASTVIEITGEEPKNFTLKGGSGQYDITYAPEGVVTADVQTFGDSGFLSITPVSGGAGGETVVTLTDKVSGDTAQIKVNVKLPISFSYTKDGASIEPTSYDTEHDPIFDTKVGETIVITVTGGSGTGYKVMGASDSHFEFDPGKTLTGNTVSVKMKAVGQGKYFRIMDSQSKFKWITFNIAEAGSAEDTGNFDIDTDGVVRKKDGATISGDIVLPDNAKTVPSNSDEFTPFNTNNEITSIDFGGVISIGKMSIMASKNLKTVHLRNVTSIGMGAFYNCTGLSKVYCHMTTPPTVDNANAFNNISENAVLYVPAGTKAAYQVMNGVDKFSSIEEME